MVQLLILTSIRRGAYDCQPGEDCLYIRWCEKELIGDTWYYTGECTQWENTGECWQTDECDGIPPSDCALYGVDCGNNGGGGNETSPDNSCNDAANKMIANTTASSDLESITTIEDGPEERTKLYKWYCITDPTYRILSAETGVHVKTSNQQPNLQWKWKSFTHSGLAMQGFIVGGDLEYKLTAATPTVGLYNAVMELIIEIKATPSLPGCKISVSKPLTCSKTFGVND